MVFRTVAIRYCEAKELSPGRVTLVPRCNFME